MLRELLASFNVDTAQAVASLKNIDKAIGGASEKLGGLLDAFVGSAVVHGFGEFVKGQIEAGSRVNDLSEKLGVGTDELQKFQLAAGLAGVDAEGAAQALGFLNKNMGEALGGNKAAAEAFQGLGVALKDGKGEVREIGDVLPEVADAFEKMGSNQERTAAAMKLFGKSGAALIPLLKGGAAGLQAMNEKFVALGGGMSEEFIAAADEAGDQIDLLKFGMSNWKSQIAFAILPTVTRFAVGLQGWVSKLITLTRTTNLAKYIVGVFGVASAASSAKAGLGFARMLGILPKNASFWKSALGLGVWGIVAALVVGLALVFEDLWTGINGGQSAIREWLNSTLGVEDTNKFFADLAKIIDDVSGAFTDLGPALKPVLKDLMQIGVDIAPYIAKAFVFVAKAIAGAIRLLGGFAEGAVAVVDAVSKLAHGDNSGIDNLGSKIGGIVDKAGDSVFGRGGLFDVSQTNESSAYGVPKSMLMPAPAAGGPVTVNQNNQVTNNIQGVKDAQGAGQAAKNGTKDALGGELGNALAAVAAGG